MAPVRAAVSAMATVPAMAPGWAAVSTMAPLPAPLGVPWGHARHEYPYQEPHQYQPPRSRARSRVPITHRAPLAHSLVCRRWQTPAAAPACARSPPAAADPLECVPIVHRIPRQRHRRALGDRVIQFS